MIKKRFRQYKHVSDWYFVDFAIFFVPEMTQTTGGT